jgi:lipopolysaccharide/colanic/teichoic acid biosynthesis glycosyltransferase
MAEERSPYYNEQMAEGEVELSRSYRRPELVSRFTPEEVPIDCQDARAYLITKRFFDIFLSVIGLVVLSPLLLVVAAFIYIDDPYGSPIFIQDRAGKNGKTFSFLKFRSMVVDAEAHLKELQDRNEMDGPVFKIRNDPRVTKFGKFIRRTSIDELPQLINIIKGEMSIVGPRPPLLCEVEKYGPYERQRLFVKPGLTCYWQARGRNEIKFNEWMALDMKYVYHHNLLIDMKILLLTARAVLTGKGAM